MDRFGNNYKDGIFVLSGIFSLFLYVLLLLLLALLFRLSEARINISINAPSAISAISVDLVEIPVSVPLETSAEEVNETPKNDNADKPKDTGSQTALSGLGMGDLFEKIDTNKPAKDSKLTDNRDKIALNKKGENTTNEKLSQIIEKTQNIMNTLENLNANIAITADSSSSKFCEKYGDYCDELYKLLYKNWNAKSSFVEKLSSKVQISISKDGNFSYTIKKKSGNNVFDKELAQSLQSLKAQKFPTLKDINIDKLEVNFTNKGRTE